MELFNDPRVHGDKLTSVSRFLASIDRWHKDHNYNDSSGFQSQMWYRGESQEYRPKLASGVYRDDFTNRMNMLGDGPNKRLHLEREMLSQFRSAGASFLAHSDEVEIYFTVQHFGMRTQLLDWSTSPLTALFLACGGKESVDGFVYAMDAGKVIPNNAVWVKKSGVEKIQQVVMSMRHPLVNYAIGLAFWKPHLAKQSEYVLPVRPDTVPGRIMQQNSCFTLHMHKADRVHNETLTKFVIEAASKPQLLSELRKLDINQFTIYYDLDHLSKEIKQSWRL